MYTVYRLVPPRHGDQFNTHAMVNERLGPARSQHSENRMRLTRFEGSTRGTGSESRTGEKEICLSLSSRRGSLAKIKKIDPIDRCVSSPGARVERPLESTRRVDYNVVKAVRNTGVGGENGQTRIGPRIRDNPCILHTVEINILIFSLGRYAHRALLTRIETPKKKKLKSEWKKKQCKR